MIPLSPTTLYHRDPPPWTGEDWAEWIVGEAENAAIAERYRRQAEQATQQEA